ncbi:hypothetical protein DSO57_1017032 [Entomophthora muscae]|uniref:Uncharacterized protein n=1 Tax=Entomophthora muscae TaxID=34485 RepID=A0ACC2TRN5_9FUNG|nr:hypothetical protein DSO57_1017032 [Entomophthora muscae]
MFFPLLKFVAFALAPVLVIIWSTSPDFWGHLSSLASYVGEDLTHLLHLLEDLPGCAQDLVATGGNLVKSLTCDDPVFSFPNSDHAALPEAGAPMVSPLLEVELPIPNVELPSHNLTPRCTPWLLGGLILMGFVRNIPDTYSYVTNKLSPAINVKVPVATEQMSAANVQTSAVIKQTSATNVQTSSTIKQIHTATMWKPATTKLLPAVNAQAPAATKQIHATTMWNPATTKLLPAVSMQAPVCHE